MRFDGVQFTVFDKGNTPGLQNSNVAGPLRGPRGQPLGRNVGRAPPVLKTAASRPTRREKGLPSNRVLAICAGPDRGALDRDGRRDRTSRRTERSSPPTGPGRALQRPHLGHPGGPGGSLWIGDRRRRAEPVSRREVRGAAAPARGSRPRSSRRFSSTAVAISGSAPTAAVSCVAGRALRPRYTTETEASRATRSRRSTRTGTAISGSGTRAEGCRGSSDGP